MKQYLYNGKVVTANSKREVVKSISLSSNKKLSRVQLKNNYHKAYDYCKSLKINPKNEFDIEDSDDDNYYGSFSFGVNNDWNTVSIYCDGYFGYSLNDGEKYEDGLTFEELKSVLKKYAEDNKSKLGNNNVVTRTFASSSYPLELFVEKFDLDSVDDLETNDDYKNDAHYKHAFDVVTIKSGKHKGEVYAIYDDDEKANLDSLLSEKIGLEDSAGVLKACGDYIGIKKFCEFIYKDNPMIYSYTHIYNEDIDEEKECDLVDTIESEWSEYFCGKLQEENAVDFTELAKYCIKSGIHDNGDNLALYDNVEREIFSDNSNDNILCYRVE